jgi:hypothetical protein
MSVFHPLRTLSADGRLSGMGTVGGKIGFGLGLVVGLLAIEPMIGLFLAIVSSSKAAKRLRRRGLLSSQSGRSTLTSAIWK